jgi:RNA recognition motif-containing protein
MNIFVANLNPSTTSIDLVNLFKKHGEVISANIIKDKATGLSRNFGFVEMKHEFDGIVAITELNNTEFKENRIVVKTAKARSDFN